jgi:hypothetical protein
MKTWYELHQQLWWNPITMMVWNPKIMLTRFVWALTHHLTRWETKDYEGLKRYTKKPKNLSRIKVISLVVWTPQDQLDKFKEFFQEQRGTQDLTIMIIFWKQYLPYKIRNAHLYTWNNPPRIWKFITTALKATQTTT